MEKRDLITKIIRNTNHTIESLAEILGIENEEFTWLMNPNNTQSNYYQLDALLDFLAEYNLVFEWL